MVDSDAPVAKRSRLGRIVRWTGSIVLGIVILLAAVIWVAGLLAPDYTTTLTPAGFPVETSTYVEISTGDKIWVNAWLPDDLEPGVRIPALFETSRYGTMLEAGWLHRAMQTVLGAPDHVKGGIQTILDRGYAAVWVQSPGSCQSTGERLIEYPPNEVEAIRAAIDWVIAQPWSDGKVGAYGTSYSATTADLMCATGSPAVRAVLARAPDFDVYTQVARPGGIGSDSFLRTWIDLIQAMDRDDFPGVVAVMEGIQPSFFARMMVGSMVAGLRRPRGDDLEIFRQALEGHRRGRPAEEMIDLLAYKHPLGLPDGQPAIGDVALYNHEQSFEASTGAMMTWGGWMDAGVAEGALQKFLTFERPMTIVILPGSHVFAEVTDAFRGTRAKTPDELVADEERFFSYFDEFIKNDAVQSERLVRYYTYGADEWHETGVWPPAGFEPEPWFFGDGGGLSPEPAGDSTGVDDYVVDFTATTGEANRWMTQMGRTVRYGDRAAEDAKLLTYTCEPLEHDLEVTGSPTVTLVLSTTHADGAFHVYLEDVAPDGVVRYLTEGLLRGIHRRTADPASAPFVPLGVYRTFAEADAEPMRPGEVERIDITLFPISTVFKEGHRIRVAVAGHDAALGTRYPETGTPEWHVRRGPVDGSFITLPVRTGNHQ